MRSHVGSKQEISPGVWRIRVTRGRRADGKRRTVSRTVHGTADDAERALIGLAHEMGADPAIGRGVTLKEYFYSYYLPFIKASFTNATAVRRESDFRLHIEPFFGGMDIAAITNGDVQRWISGLPPKSAQSYARTFRAVMSRAKFDHAISQSPFDGYVFTYPRRDTSPLPVWGPREVSIALASEDFRASRLFPLWCVMVGAGLSRSEGLALDWPDISWSSALGMDGSEHWHARVSVTKACTLRDGMKGPKNSRRYRRVPLAPAFADVLRPMAGDGPICTTARGGRMMPGSVPEMWMALFDEGAPLHGLRYVPLNRMRATFSTLAQAAGLDYSIINALQGRSNNSQVLYTNYLAPQEDTFNDAVSRIQSHIDAASGRGR